VKHPTFWVDRQPAFGSRLGRIVRVRQQKPGETERERRLADAARPAQQDRMRQPPGFDEPPQLALCAFVTDEVMVRPRCGNPRCMRRLL
jgi:hypothetical protein